MSTDHPEGTEPSRPGRAPRIGDSRSPVGSTLSIVLAVVAVVAGFLILKSLRDDDDSAGAGDPSDQSDDSSGGSTTINTGVDDDPTSTSAGGSTQTTVAQRTGATIAVANASGEGGTAGTMSTAIQSAGYDGVGEPGNRSSAQAIIEQSIVYYVTGDAQAQAVAATLARELGVGAPEPMPDPRPVDGNGATSTATVLVLLGSAQAGEPLTGSSATPPQVSGATTTTAG